MSYAPMLLGSAAQRVPGECDSWQWIQAPFRLAIKPEAARGYGEHGYRWSVEISATLVEAEWSETQEEAIEVLEDKCDRMLEALALLCGLEPDQPEHERKRPR